MSWARFDDNYCEHPKVLEAGAYAELLNSRAIIYSARNTTDGFISPAALYHIRRAIPNHKKHVAKLVEVGLWDVVDGGWMVHDYLKFNPSKADIEAGRSADRTRQEIYRTRGLADEIKGRDGDFCRYCGHEVNWKDRRGPKGAVFEHVVPVTQGGHTTLDNIVVACRDCNAKKGGRTPEQAGMTLRSSEYLGSDLDTPGRDGTGISSGQEQTREMAKSLADLADPTCPTCEGLGSRFNERGENLGPCPCTKIHLRLAEKQAGTA